MIADLQKPPPPPPHTHTNTESALMQISNLQKQSNVKSFMKVLMAKISI